MAKSKKKVPKRTSSASKILKESPGVDLLQVLENPRNVMIFFGLLLIALVIIYKPIVFDGLDVQGSDVVSGIGNTKQVKQYEAETGERALWSPFMFAGMPVYHRHGGVSWSFDTLLRGMSPVLDWRVTYLLLGGIGIFLLLKYLGLSSMIGLLAALAFVMIPHSHALIVVGHFSKLRALMWMPLVTLAFLYLLDKKSFLAMFLFTLVFALQLRTQHYQIIFYNILLLFFVGIVPYLKMAIEKRWSDFLKFSGLFIAAIGLVVAIVAQPLFVTNDYTPYSTRGGNAINLNEQIDEKDKKGAGFDYATSWSYSASELWNLIVPRFHGGTSDETIRVPALNNQPIPAYWGDLPITQSYEYLSVILAFLALVGIIFQWRNPYVKSLTFLTILALLLSLGRNFAPLYKLFFYYLPLFDKFRVPMMILTLVSFNVCVLAAFGLNFIMNAGLKDKENQKKFLMLSGGYFVLLLIPLLFGSSFALTQTGEMERYAARAGQDQARQLIEIFREARLGVLKASAMRTLFFFAIGVAMLFFLSREKSKRNILIAGLTLLIALDLGMITTRYLEGTFVDPVQVENQVYRENAVDRVIKQDKSLYRVLPPIRRMAQDSRWTYHYQSIGGYNPAKTQVIQDIITNNIINPTSPRMPLNLNVVGMLNGKYIVANQPYNHPDLTPLGQDQRQELHLFRNEKALPRAFFVGNTRVIEDGVERLNFLNSPAFDPAKIAVLEEPLEQTISAPDSNSRVEVSHFSPNRIEVKTASNTTSVLVLSEVYYPKGWTAQLETGEVLKIYKTNHILRSMVVPSGEHTITLTFSPQTYYTGVTISWIGWILTYVGLAFFLFRALNNKKQQPE